VFTPSNLNALQVYFQTFSRRLAKSLFFPIDCKVGLTCANSQAQSGSDPCATEENEGNPGCDAGLVNRDSLEGFTDDESGSDAERTCHDCEATVRDGFRILGQRLSYNCGGRER